MKCLVALALLTAAPALAQTGCPTAADRDRGIRLDFSTGGSEVYRPAAAGVVTVNGGTFGSEPHMPFGGTKLSGNGTREPGTEALEVYSELRDIYLNLNPAQL